MKSADSVAIPEIKVLLNHVQSELRKLLEERLKRLIIRGSYSRRLYDKDSYMEMTALAGAPRPLDTFVNEVHEVIVNLSLKLNTVISMFAGPLRRRN